MMRAYRRFSHIQILIPSAKHPGRWDFACGNSQNGLGNTYAQTCPPLDPWHLDSPVAGLQVCAACLTTIQASRDQDGRWAHTPDGDWWWQCTACPHAGHDTNGRTLRQTARAHRLNHHGPAPTGTDHDSDEFGTPSLLHLLDGGDAA